MFKPESAATGHLVHLYAEPGVVHHAHQVPSGPLWLAVLGVIPAAHCEFVTPSEIGERDIHSPVNPAVHHAELVRLLEAVNRRWPPGVSIIERHLDAVDWTACAV